MVVNGPGAGAAEQYPAGIRRRHLVQVGDGGPRDPGPAAAAGQQVVAGRFGLRQFLDVDHLRPGQDGRQALRGVQQPVHLIAELCGPGRRHIQDVDHGRIGVEHEVDVLVPAFDHHTPVTGELRRDPGQLAGHRGVDFRPGHQGRLRRRGQQPDFRDRAEQRAAVAIGGLGHLSERHLGAGARDDEPRAAVDVVVREVGLQRFLGQVAADRGEGHGPVLTGDEHQAPSTTSGTAPIGPVSTVSARSPSRRASTDRAADSRTLPMFTLAP